MVLKGDFMEIGDDGKVRQMVNKLMFFANAAKWRTNELRKIKKRKPLFPLD